MENVAIQDFNSVGGGGQCADTITFREMGGIKQLSS